MITQQAAFERLAEALKQRKLPCENTPARFVPADEFMLMDMNPGKVSFKHHNTRNYIYLVKQLHEWVLEVPNKGTFTQGWFDASPSVEIFQRHSQICKHAKGKGRVPVEYNLTITLHTSVQLDTPRDNVGIDLHTGEQLAKLAMESKYNYLGNLDIQVVDHNTNPGGL